MFSKGFVTMHSIIEKPINGNGRILDRPRIAKHYDYRDECGDLLFQTLRFEPKDFRQRRPDGKGGWIWNLEGVRRVLYLLPEILADTLNRPVLVVEGERDADALHDIGLLATTNPMGAGKWLPEYSEQLRGRRVVILPDNDEPGQKHATQVAESLHGKAAGITLVNLPNLPPKGDVSDYLAAGNTKEDLLKLILNAPEWAPASSGADDGPSPVIVSIASVVARPAEWLWPGRIPRGALTILDGDPGLGKSTLALDLAARVSRGWLMPPAAGPVEGAEPEGVLLLSAEDDPATTIRPRLDVAGADVSRIYYLEAIRDGDEERPPVLPWDLAHVERLIVERDIGLIVVDPFMAYLDGEIDAHKDQDVRRCLHRLKGLAQSTGVAILLIRHLNKMNHNTAMYRGGGSIGIIGAARSALLVGPHTQEPKIRVLASVKSNLGPAPRSLAYALEPAGDVARIGWIGESDLSADEILAQPGAGKKSAGEQCAEALRGLLEDGPKESAELDNALKQLGYSENAVKKARSILKVKVRKVGFGKDGSWMVSLPEEPAEVE